MKSIIRSLTVAGAAAWFATSAANAQILVDDFYVKAQLGPSFTERIPYKNAPGHINVNPGARGDLIFGSDFTPFLAGEFEVGALGNSLDTGPGQPLNAIAFDAELVQLPILANIIFKAPLMGGVTPYIGAGAGGVASTLSLRTTRHDWTSDTDFTFAYQAIAGIDFALNHRMSVGVTYKYLASLDHQWFSEDPVLVTRTEDIHNHSVMASFNFKF